MCDQCEALATAGMKDHARLESARARLARDLADCEERRQDALDAAEHAQDEVGGLQREVERLRDELRGSRRTVAELTARLAAVDAAIGPRTGRHALSEPAMVHVSGEVPIVAGRAASVDSGRCCEVGEETNR